jgi:CheY-like chemotaxis protein
MKALPTGKETILFVDDDSVLLEIWETLLGSLGYTVDKRTSAGEALEAFANNSQKYDLIITDMTMPEVTGDKLVIEVRKVRNDIPIILSSGFSAENDDVLMELNINAILMKPTTFFVLANTVRNILDEKIFNGQGIEG